MVDAKNERTLFSLQQMQASLVELTRRFQQVERRFDRLECGMDNVRTTSATLLGFGMHSILRQVPVEERMAELERQFGTLDDLKRRVCVSEQAR